MSYIKRETVEKVEEASDLVEVIQTYVDLKKSGSSYKGLSPFITESTPSFVVNPAKEIWKDFSSGKGGNNCISFLMEIEKISFPEAVELLAKKYAIEVEYENSDFTLNQRRRDEKNRELQPLLESVIRKYEEEFHKLPEDHPAKIEIYQRRGYSPELVKKYRIGYAPGNKFIFNLCMQTGRKQDAISIGLISENNDKWIDRVIYPLIDRKGVRAFSVGLAGRRLGENKKYPKWINSVESDLYKKDSFWYGLDKAQNIIQKKNEVWIVEGYNDVIAWQENGILNTVASCGTAISEKQIRILKKLCDRVIFCFDPDDAGKKAVLKYIPEFISKGFRVQTVTLVPDIDPDDFVRFWTSSVSKYGLAHLGTEADFREDGFKLLMDENFKGKDEVDRAKEAKSLAKVIGKIEDEAIRGIYTSWLSKESGVKLPEVKNYIKSAAESQSNLSSNQEDGLYRLPPSVHEPFDQLRPVIEKYQLFTANNQIWVQQKGDPPYTFRAVTNFTIEIIQHMQDEKSPMKLIRLKNVHGLERIFDIPSSEINSPMTFENAVTAHGNFRWKGNKVEHELLKTYLFDKMGTGRKIEVLGWQPEGFFVWNNLISDPCGSNININENGIFKKDQVSYYVPSANQIYRGNLYKFEAQKKVTYRKASVLFENFTSQVIKVHREHGMTGILFSVASIFQDIVVSELNMFPMLFLYGPPSSGKDQLADVCQSFFGQPQTAINLEGGVSTIKAQVREFAQFSNTISHLSEYKNGDSRLDGVLKGLWDRRGYKRGNLDSHVGTDSIPILSSVIMTGNYAPDQEALITRFIWEFMDKDKFNREEIAEYEKLSDITKKGISSYTEEFLKHRSLVEEKFKNVFREFQATLKERKPEAISRMISNLSVLGSFYQIFKDIMPFTFSHGEMMQHFEKTIDKQMNKLDSASIINRWWDCFLASMRGTLSDQISVGRDFKLSGNHLYFNFTSCYNRVSRQWFSQYKDSAPPKGLMIDSLKKDKAWIKVVPGIRMAPGRDSKSTSAYMVDIENIPIRDEIKFAIDFQSNESIRYLNPNVNRNEENEDDDLPF